MPEQPNAFLFCLVSATFTSEPSIPHTGMPASITADGRPRGISGPAARQNRSSISDAGTGLRQAVTTFSVGTCHSCANGTAASSPASRRSASQYEASGIRVIATIRRMTSGNDISRLRCCTGSRPPAVAAATSSSITPSPRWRSSSPSHTKSGSQPPASTLPPRITAGTVTTGWQNITGVPGSASAPAGTAPRSPASPTARACRSTARTAIIPADSAAGLA